MEDGRYWPPLIVLVLAVGLLFGFRYLEQVDVANNALVDAKLALKQARESLEGRKGMWAIVDAASRKLAMARQKQKDAALMQEEANKKQRLVEGDLLYTTKSLKAAVDKVRADALGSEIPEVVLLNGTVLKTAKIRKVDNTSVSFLHSTGSSSVQADQLQQDMLEKFDLGPRALIPQLEQLQASLNLSNASEESGSMVNPELLSIRRRLIQFENEINSLTIHKDKLEAEVRDYEAQIQKAQDKGASTFSLRTMRDIAEGNAGTARNELKRLKTEMEKLRATEISLMAKR